MTSPQGSNPFTFLGNLWFSYRPVLLIVVLVLFSLYTNEAIIHYRMDEYNRAMETLSQTSNSSHALNMLARFELIKQRQNMPDEDETALELRLQSLAAGKLIVGEERDSSLKYRVIGAAIRGLGYILGKKRPKAEVSKVVLRELEVAYFYERSRKYDKAIEIYTLGLAHPGLSPGVAATLLLHRGFCASLIGDYRAAREDFDRAAALVPDTEEAHVAIKLKEITLGLEEQVRLAKESKQTPFRAGRQLFLLANYAEAAKRLAEVINNARADSAERLVSRYLYARSQEEMGLDSDAVVTYRTVIQQAPNSDEARKSNRRLYVLGKYYSNDADLAKSALRKIEQFQDFKFINSLKSLEVPKAVHARRQAAASIEAVGAVGVETGSVKLDKLDHVDEAALRGEGERAKPVPVIAEAEKVAAALKKDVRARSANAKIIADPLRQEAIFGSIENNQGELEFLYQKFLRKGTVFEGNLTIRILITPEGAVRDARIVSEKSTIDHSAFNSEILQNVKKWRFREDPNANGDVPVTFPVRFVNKQ